MRGRALGLLGVLVATVVVAGLAVSPGETQTPRKGGVLRVGMIGEPPTLDGHATTAVITREIGINVFEGLYALDARYQPAPLLAEGHDVLDGGRRYAIRLRKNARFHNGKALTSADVVASLTRWGATASTGKAIFKTVEAVEAKGPNAIEIRLKEPSASLLTVLAQVDSAAVIYPKEVIDATGPGQLKEFVGTGPFRFVEHKPDRHVKLARFDDYAARSEPSSGLAGRRTAYVDEILFMPVPDYATRQAGMLTGEYVYIQQVKPDQVDRLKSAPGVEPVVVKPYGWATIVFNTRQGLMTDLKLRQAAQAALDVEPMMLAGLGHKDFYRIDPGLFFQELPWHSKAGAALYNQRDKDKARRLLKEAGYAGQPMRWIVTTEYEHHYKPAVVAKSQLEEVGFKVDLQVSDWATVVQRRNKPELWDAFSTAFVFVPEPATSAQVLCDWPGWWCNPEKDQLLQAMGRELDFKKRFAMWEQVQTIFYAEAPRIKIGDYFRLDARRKHVAGYEPGPYMHFWNVWLDRR
ncbi:MAG: ABC transporter substrate-binding protein [Candidatus Rokuibacteriota bacterium]|nr:MAG: ABC transporter substrate-binding protein [Candidatus Rokubacteria bacterium]